VVELATGRSWRFPRSSGRRIDPAPGRRRRAAPAAALPQVEPTPTPTPAPAGPDVAAAPVIASAWIEAAGGRVRLHLDRLVPTSEGGMRVAASMPAIDLGSAPAVDEELPGVRVLPRPGSPQFSPGSGAPTGARAGSGTAADRHGRCACRRAGRPPPPMSRGVPTGWPWPDRPRDPAARTRRSSSSASWGPPGPA
jgi:hypothetical protein